MNIKQSFLLLLCFLSIKLSAQDAHFSYYQFAPTVVNPSFTGAYYGNIRATILRRSQWFNVGNSGNDGFNTVNLLLDGNLPFGLKEGDWVSLGLNMLQEDQSLALVNASAGILDMTRGYQGFSAAYHMTMGKKSPAVMTFSAKYGTYKIGFGNGTNINSITGSNLENGSIDGAIVDADEQRVQGLMADMDARVNSDTKDIQIGVMYTTPVGKTSDMRMGISFDHLMNPGIDTILGAGFTENKIDRRINGFIQYYTDINDKLTFNPTILYQKMGAASNLLLQSLFSYHHNKSKDLFLNFGVGVRLASNMDIPIYLGADFKDWRIGLSFDLNMSGLANATNNAGAYELGISKIFKWDKKAEVKPKLICPRL